ncbi:hypothetical protein AB8B21_03090 [Tardiphaga sp. 866_E4_N2_1]|uniref:hypothetical protein n=1 Tax=unclassified Tardiphaga TaxID=2631404 RepID=UPI003F21B16E
MNTRETAQSAESATVAGPRVLIVAHTTTFLTELSLFGNLMRERAQANTIFYCPFVHWTAEAFASRSRADGVPCLLPPLKQSLAEMGLQPQVRARPLQRVAGRFFSRVATKLASKLPGVGLSFLAERLAFSIAADEISMLLSATRPDLLVLGGDMVGYDTSLYIKLAHQAEIPVLVVPSTMSNGLEQAEVYFADPNYHVSGLARQSIALMFPKWVRTHRGRKLFRCPPGRVLAMELGGLAPPQPWIFNSGSADAIAMESQAMIDYYAEAGMKNDRMVLTGTLSDDAMADRMARAGELRRQLCDELELDPARPLVLTALPPDFLYLAGGRPECDFQDYRALVDFWIQALADTTGCNHIVALHPSVDPDEMRYIERDGIRIGRWRTAEMVPACDIYVASISSTIRWAIACGKPVVNYDVYRYRYTDFQDVSGVLATEEQHEFRALLTRLTRDEEYSRDVALAQQSAANHWGVLDGGAGDRMLQVVTQLSTSGHVPPISRPSGLPSERATSL